MDSAEFVIVGAGAMGSILAARLIAAGRRVCLVARGRRAQQLADSGLVVTGLERHAMSCSVITEPAQLKQAEVVIFAVKTYDHAAVLKSLAHVQTETVFSLCNGISKDQELTKYFGASPVLGCMAEFSGELSGSGEVIFTRNNALYLGEITQRDNTRLKELCRQFDKMGIEARAVNNITEVEWSKFVGWTPMMALSVLSRQTTARFLADPGYAQLAVAIVREIAELAQAVGISLVDHPPVPVASIAALPDDEALPLIADLSRSLQANAPEHKVSALQDLEKGRPLEVEETLGYALSLARQFNLSTPQLQTCYTLVSGINRME